MVTRWDAMAERRTRRNPYRPGTVSYAHARETDLRRRLALGRVNAARAKTPETRRRAKRVVSAAQQALRALEEREEYRSHLIEQEREIFGQLPIREQQREVAARHKYPDGIPSEVPDPFVGRNRERMWSLFYATRAGFRHRTLKRQEP
jgi:hypothetical protein